MRPTTLAEWCACVAEDRRFQNAILAVILLNAVIVGVETSGPLMAEYGRLFVWANRVVLAVFVAEIAVRVAAYWPRTTRFFHDGWNVFDLAVVAASLLPEAGSFATVARLARLLRVTRLVSVSPDLRLIVATMLRSIPSMGHVIALLGLLLYVYGVLGYYLFHRVDPAHWGTLGVSALTLFQILTLEGWVEIQKATMAALPWSWVYFASFVVVAVFVVVNLFIAVVINNLETAKAEHQAEADARSPHHVLLARLHALRGDLDEVERLLRQAEQEGLAPGRRI